ncbi:MAG TPA: PD-(D/E)XK nuclease family protein [Candidatus Paceibacterota bacterium]|nr:PD-(D/E)XK nuclease family protein [Candidatus Paceibacterota bacterium]
MAGFYPKGKRSADWNYGGAKWKLSRSKLDLFIECPRCFYVDNKLGVARPKGFPFNLNSAVDHLLKKEFDGHRAARTAHPLMAKYGVDAIPFAHAELNIWRENFEGIQHRHDKSGLLISGAVDDVWVNSQGELIVVDYKSTSKQEGGKVSLDAEWQDGYKRQMEVYQWLLRRKGFKVSDTGYFVYANGLRDRKAFDGKLEFDVTLISYTGDDGWVEEAIMKAKECLDGEKLPEPSQYCEYCNYRKLAQEVQMRFVKKKTEETGNDKNTKITKSTKITKNTRRKKKEHESNDATTNSLF